jgi:hypothetical protein
MNFSRLSLVQLSLLPKIQDPSALMEEYIGICPLKTQPLGCGVSKVYVKKRQKTMGDRQQRSCGYVFFSIQNDPLSKVNMVMSEKQSGDCPQILPQVKVTTRQSVEFMVDSK